VKIIIIHKIYNIKLNYLVDANEQKLCKLEIAVVKFLSPSLLVSFSDTCIHNSQREIAFLPHLTFHTTLILICVHTYVILNNLNIYTNDYRAIVISLLLANIVS